MMNGYMYNQPIIPWDQNYPINFLYTSISAKFQVSKSIFYLSKVYKKFSHQKKH